MGRELKGEGDRKRRGRTRLGYLSRGPELVVTSLCTYRLLVRSKAACEPSHSPLLLPSNRMTVVSSKLRFSLISFFFCTDPRDWLGRTSPK